MHYWWRLGNLWIHISVIVNRVIYQWSMKHIHVTVDIFYLLIVLGIEFYLFVPLTWRYIVWMTEGPCVNFVMREALFEIYMWILCLHTSMRNKKVEFNPYIYTLSKLSRFCYEISVFKYTTGRYSGEPPEQPAHTSRMFLHGKMDVKIFHMFIEQKTLGV